ncbi:MAG: hypothetical protein VB934_13820 [Polyangiaceae bacterium]
MVGLQFREPDAARCVGCGALAVGPCARCHDPVCGDCCVLTEGSAKPWAVCLSCDASGGRSLAGGWLVVLQWIGWPILILLLVVIVLSWFFK